MFYREFQPTNAARRFIRCFWVLDDPTPSMEPQRIFPDGRSELIFNLAESFESSTNQVWVRQPNSFIVGQITGPMLIRAGGPAKIVGIRFHPHGVRHLLRTPSSELTDTVVPLSDINSTFRGFSDRLYECRSWGQQVRLIEQAAVEVATRNRCSQNPAMAFAVSEFERTQGLAPIGDVARQLGISTRQLQRRFLAEVGVSCKLFCRMQRFQRVLRVMEEPTCKWADTAMECGYYDQAHLIRDFRQFTGKAPTTLLAQELRLTRRFVS